MKSMLKTSLSLFAVLCFALPALTGCEATSDAAIVGGDQKTEAAEGAEGDDCPPDEDCPCKKAKAEAEAKAKAAEAK